MNTFFTVIFSIGFIALAAWIGYRCLIDYQRHKSWEMLKKKGLNREDPTEDFYDNDFPSRN